MPIVDRIHINVKAELHDQGCLVHIFMILLPIIGNVESNVILVGASNSSHGNGDQEPIVLRHQFHHIELEMRISLHIL